MGGVLARAAHRTARAGACDHQAQRTPDAVPPLGAHRLAWSSHKARPCVERPLRPGRLIIGRTSDNDLQIDSKFVSRHHCQIVTTLDSCVIEDLNSTNGIYVKAKRVRKHNLNDGDVVIIGKHELMYIDERAHLKGRSGIDSPEVAAAAREEAWGS